MNSHYQTSPTTAYTLGIQAVYDKHCEEKRAAGEIPYKIGRSEDCPGGSVWQTAEEVFVYLMTVVCKDSSKQWAIYRLQLPDSWDRNTTTVRFEDGKAIPVEPERIWHDLLVDAEIVERVRPVRLGIVTARSDQKIAVEAYTLSEDQLDGWVMSIGVAMEACSGVGVSLDVDTYDVGSVEWLRWWNEMRS